MKKYVVRTFVALAVMTLAMTATAFASEPDVSIITVDVRTTGGVECDYAAQRVEYEILRDRIAYANRLYDSTFVDVYPGANTPTTAFWAPIDAFAVFRAAINAALEVRPILTVAPNQEIEVSVGIAGNPGFSGMIIRFDIPDGLEVIGFSDAPLAVVNGAFSPLPLGAFTAPTPLPSATAPMTGRLYAGWAGRSYDLTGNGELFSFTLRATANAPAAGGNVYMTFANATDISRYEIPTNSLQQDVPIFFPSGLRNTRRADGDVDGRTYTVTTVAFQ